MALGNSTPVSLPVQAGSAPHLRFLLLLALSLIVLSVPLSSLVNLAIHDERYTQALLIPFISGWVGWWQRKRILRDSHDSPGLGISILLAGGVLVGIMTLWPSLDRGAGLSVIVFAIILIWTGLFVWSYGPQALHRAIFPALFLLLLIPIPPALMDRAVIALQKGSADMSYILFKIIGMPVLRDGFRFSLPGVDIEIAEECSGIRSSLSLFICSLLVGHLLLRSGWSRLWFSLLTIPVVIFKNAVRIVTISWLGIYVDRGFLFGTLHHDGGLAFSLVAIAILALALRILQRFEPGSKATIVSRDGPAPSIPSPDRKTGFGSRV